MARRKQQLQSQAAVNAAAQQQRHSEWGPLCFTPARSAHEHMALAVHLLGGAVALTRYSVGFFTETVMIKCPHTTMSTAAVGQQADGPCAACPSIAFAGM